MKHRPALLLAILLYVTLDLSLATMPGAFVFDSAESVECTQSRARAGLAAAALPAPGPDVLEVARPPLAVKERPAAVTWREPRRRPAMPRRAAVPLDPASSSEDPH